MRAPDAARTVAGRMLYRGARSIATAHGPFDAHVFSHLDSGAPAFAVTRGDLRGAEPLTARIHSSCVTSEAFCGCDCDCADQLDRALGQIAAAGRGAVFYLMQEGRGVGFAAKVRDRMIVQASGHRLTTFDAYAQMGLPRDARRYDAVGAMASLLGVEAPLLLLTNNPDKQAGVERDAGVAVAGTRPLCGPPTAYNRHYLDAKARSGHRLDAASRGAGEARAVPPAPGAVFEPHLLHDAPRFLHLATYFLPVRAGGGDPTWFGLHAYFDLDARCERVVLGLERSGIEPLVRLQPECLLDRFLPAARTRDRRLWLATARRIAAHGAGFAAFVAAAGFDARLRERRGDARAATALLAHHLRGRRCRIVTDSRRETRESARLVASLARAGARVAGRVALDGGRAVLERSTAARRRPPRGTQRPRAARRAR